MIVRVDDIHERGLHLDELISLEQVRAALEDARGSGFSADRGFRLLASLHRVGTGVLLKGGFTAQVSAPCSRCVKEVQLSLPASFTLTLVAEDFARDAGLDEEGEDDEQAEHAGSFRLEDAEEETFDGKEIDLDPILREQILLALPMNALCTAECKGLCGMCGQNLNERACGCDPHVPDPRFAALKHFKIN